jgi:hypothetical protein
MLDAIRKQIVAWGIRFIFKKIPVNWMDKFQVREFMTVNRDLFVFIVQQTNLGIENGFRSMFDQVLSNTILFDVFFDGLNQLWTNPRSLVDISGGQVMPIKMDNSQTNQQTIRERIRAKIQQRRSSNVSRRAEDTMEIVQAESPGSVLAIIVVLAQIANIAAIIVRFRQNS